jgi:hypothetical protein
MNKRRRKHNAYIYLLFETCKCEKCMKPAGIFLFLFDVDVVIMSVFRRRKEKRSISNEYMNICMHKIVKARKLASKIFRKGSTERPPGDRNHRSPASHALRSSQLNVRVRPINNDMQGKIFLSTATTRGWTPSTYPAGKRKKKSIVVSANAWNPDAATRVVKMDEVRRDCRRLR